MSTFALEAIDARVRPGPIPLSDVDATSTAQIVVAWAGEGGEDPRLSWWPCDLVSEFGGEGLFVRVLPNTSEWATLQAVRESARRRDAELRQGEGAIATALAVSVGRGSGGRRAGPVDRSR